MKILGKTVSVLLAGLMCAQIAVPSFAADTDNNQYTGQILAAINTNYDNTSASFTTAEGGYEPGTEEEETVGECGCDVIDDVEILTPEQADIAAKKIAGESSADAFSSSYEVGDEKTLNIVPYNDSEMTVQCIYTGESCTVWVNEDELDDEAREIYTNLGIEADEIIPREIELLGDVRIDTDRDGKIAIFVYSMDGAGGCFTNDSLVNEFGMIGNVYTTYYLDYLKELDHIDCINVSSGENFDYQLHTVAHEYQHYINHCYNYYGKTNRTYNPYNMETYLNEGFSDSVALVMTDYDREFDPNNYYNNFSYTLTADSYDTHDYYLGFGFCQYLRTRYAELTGDTEGKYPGSGLYRKVLEARNKDNGDNTLGIIADMLYPSADYPSLKDTDARCRQLIVDFWMACILNNPTGDWGFNGDAWAEENISLCSYSPAECLPGPDGIKISGGMASLCYIDNNKEGTATVTSADDGIVFIAVEDDFHSVTYNLADGSSYSEIDDDTYINGYNSYPYRFLGWSTDPDAEAPEYTKGQTITLSEDLNLYPVFRDDAEKIEIGSTYEFEESDFIDCEKFFKFTVPETGYYTFRASCYGNEEIYDDTNNRVGPCFYDYTEDDDFEYKIYELTAGTQYRMYVYYADWPDSFELSSEKTGKIYTVTYDAGDYGLEECSSIFNEFYIQYFEDLADDYANFEGWSLTEGSDSVDYLPGDTITVDGDMTLYAVIAPAVTLYDGDNSVPDSYTLFTFTPESTGLYRFSSDSEYCYFILRDGDTESDDYSDDGFYEYCLEEGVTYTVVFLGELQDSGCNTIRIEYIDGSGYFVTYYDDFTAMALSFGTDGNGYTIIDFPVFLVDSSSLLGWTTDEDYIEGESPLYKVGDTIYIDEDTFLYPVRSDTEGLSVVQHILNLFINFIKWLFKFVPFYMKVRLGMI